jgi:CHAT domain-containing protein
MTIVKYLAVKVIRFIMICFILRIITTDVKSNISERKIINQVEYKEVLHKILGIKETDKIDYLKKYLIEHPQFEDIYLKLLYTYIEYDKIDEAYAFFYNKSFPLNTSYLDEWMLARICLLNKNEKDAQEHFRMAFKEKKSSIKMIYDFIQYFQDSSMVLKVLRNRMTSPSEKCLIMAMIETRIRRYEEAVKYIEKNKLNYSLNPFINQIYGNIYYNVNNFRKADSIWKVGLEKSRQIGDFESEAKLLNSLGNLECTKLNFNQAFMCFLKSDSIASHFGIKQIMQLNASSRGNAYYDIDRYEDALQYYEKAIRLTKEIKDESRLAEWYKYKGWTYIQLNKYSETLLAYELSENYARKSNNQQDIIEIILSKAELYDFLDQNEIALDQLIEASNIAKANKYNKLNYEIESEMEKLKVKKSDYRTAKKQYIKYIKYLESKNRVVEQADWINKLADIYRLEGDMQQSKKYFNESTLLFGKANSPVYQAWSMLSIADLESLEGSFCKAIEIRQKVEKVAKKYNRLDLLLDVQVGYGDDYRLKEDNLRSKKAYQKAINIIEEMRGSVTLDQLRMSYFSKYSNLYRKQIDNYADLAINYPSAAIIDSIKNLILSGTERNLQEKLDDRLVEIQAQQHNEKLSYRTACSKLQELQHMARELRMRMISNDTLKYYRARIEAAKYSVIGQRLKMKISKTNKNRRTINNGIREEKLLEEMRKKNAAILIIHISDEKSFEIALNMKDTSIVRLNTNSKMIQQTVDSLIEPFHQNGKTSIEMIQFRANLAFNLYQILIKPVEHILNRSNSVIIIPDESLINLPFEILLCEKPFKINYTPLDTPDYANNFLLHRYSFLYSPIIGNNKKRDLKVGHKPRMCIFANPFMESYSYNSLSSTFRSPIFGKVDPLPFAELEAERIYSINHDVRTFTREEATEKCFEKESQKADIMHFATHAFFDSTFDSFSGLVLAETEDPKDDGLLMGYEIADRRLNLDLIALSACETGRGKKMAGEGILGLPRIFLGSGAKTVLMTLWKVDDHFSSIIMPLFYDNYLNKRLNKAEALAEAKRAIFDTCMKKSSDINIVNNTSKNERTKDSFMLIKNERRKNIREWAVKSNSTGIDYRHPFFWASFMLFGEQGAGVGLGRGAWIKKAFVIIGCVLGMFLLVTIQKMKNRKKKRKK